MNGTLELPHNKKRNNDQTSTSNLKSQNEPITKQMLSSAIHDEIQQSKMQDIINLETDQRMNDYEFKVVQDKKGRIKPKLGEGAILNSPYENFQSKFRKKLDDKKIWLSFQE
ncbi:hypothetical protein WA026_005334 [Henosepilachna vigintioctopunctata]|uniref:Uncharacterized protein n=1 Tax=Henosepilachna vigintioctopunctata TaxID=420089 RepID=A0AAW1UU71_9CUCU